MKKILTLSFLFLLLLPVKKINAQKTNLDGLPQGAVATNAMGFTMTAKINGKACKAHAMMPPDKAGEIVGFYDGDKYIGLPYHKKDLVVGKKISFSDENADLTSNDEVQVWNGRKGEMEITKVNGNWAEGKFFLPAIATTIKKR